jgi:hypothetical protein
MRRISIVCAALGALTLSATNAGSGNLTIHTTTPTVNIHPSPTPKVTVHPSSAVLLSNGGRDVATGQASGKRTYKPVNAQTSINGAAIVTPNGGAAGGGGTGGGGGIYNPNKQVLKNGATVLTPNGGGAGSGGAGSGGGIYNGGGFGASGAAVTKCSAC